jgi:hypothetical protein
MSFLLYQSAMNLVYYTLGGDDRFRSLVDLSIRSLREYGKYDGDVRILECSSPPYNRKCSSEESSINKLNIHKLDLNKYDKIMYLDADVLVCSDINPIFSKIKKISVGEERELMCTNNWFGAYMFSTEETFECIAHKIHGINAGIFGFPAQYAKYINEISDSVSSDLGSHSFAEQPTLNRYLFRNRDLYETNLTNDIVLFAKPDKFDEYKNKTFLHFCGGIGSYDRKFSEMDEMMRLLNDSRKPL